MKKELNKQDIINLLEDSNYSFKVTRPSKDTFKVSIRPNFYKCFSCEQDIFYKLLEVRLDARVTSLVLPRKFCKSCVKVVDNLLHSLKKKSSPIWLNQDKKY
tara:strand:- start:523 stop:828 length:306 start_codon:yes stop_codon:yes gene_type:complete